MAEKMIDKLKPCPFCGGEVEMKVEGLGGGEFYSFCCDSCMMYVEYQYCNKAEAIEAWNTRKPMDRIVKKLEEMMQRHIAEAKRQEEYGDYYRRDHERYAAGTYKYFIKQLRKECKI